MVASYLTLDDTREDKGLEGPKVPDSAPPLADSVGRAVTPHPLAAPAQTA